MARVHPNASKYGSVPGMLFNLEIADPKARMEANLNAYRESEETQSFEEPLMRRHLKVISARAEPTAMATFEMDAAPEFCSRMDTMQGGAVALAFDMATSVMVAIISKKGFWDFSGVSRTLSVTYLRPIPIGTRLEIECEIMQIGTRLATIHGKMKDKDTGKMLAVAEHNKASVALEGSGKL